MIDHISRFWNSYYKPVSRIIMFVVAVGFITYLLPKTSKFGYEYIRGMPWKHSVLIAQFDFPIYKTQEELKSETDSLLQNFRPYFTKDTAVFEKMAQRFHQEVDQFIVANTTQFSALAQFYKKDTSYFDYVKHRIDAGLKQVYDEGIIVLPEAYAPVPTFEFMLIQGAYVEPFELSEVNLQADAYQQLRMQGLGVFLADTTKLGQLVHHFVSELSLNKYIEANIIFDQSRTAEEQQNLQNNISLTAGRVLAGQRIIDQGEIVNDQTAKVLDSLKRDFESGLTQASSFYLILGGQFLIISLLFGVIYLFLYYFRRDVYEQVGSIGFLMLIMILLISLANLGRLFPQFPFYIIPFAILPIIVRTFFDSRLAFFIYVITILISAFFADSSFQFVFLQIPTGLIAMFSLFRMVRRSHIVRAALFIFLTYSLFYTALSLWQEGDVTKIDWHMFGHFAANGIMVLMVYPLIWIFERLFGFLSDVTLVELADTNHPILRKLAEATPGTFQHSVQVGNLAQEVAYKLDANPALVRAGAMYHDIGKMASPMFFTENQASGLNPHNELDFEESALIVINHIENGVRLATKHKLPRQIIDFIVTHQGTTKTRYFYNSFINKYPDRVPDISMFSYPGPTPFTKETAILMMADSIEAASRSLKSYSDDEIDKLVEKIVGMQIEEDQFIDAPITFKEISIAKEVFKSKLKNIYHARIEYPSINKKGFKKGKHSNK